MLSISHRVKVEGGSSSGSDVRVGGPWEDFLYIVANRLARPRFPPHWICCPWIEACPELHRTVVQSWIDGTCAYDATTFSPIPIKPPRQDLHGLLYTELIWRHYSVPFFSLSITPIYWRNYSQIIHNPHDTWSKRRRPRWSSTQICLQYRRCPRAGDASVWKIYSNSTLESS